MSIPGIYSGMADDDLAGIVARAMAEAREKGLENVDQTVPAVRAVLAARPDITASDAITLIRVSTVTVRMNFMIQRETR